MTLRTQMTAGSLFNSVKKPFWTWSVLAVTLLANRVPGQSWSTVDDFQYSAGGDSEATGMAKDPSGAIYVAGYGADSMGNYHALIQKSSDSGTTSTIVDDFTQLNQPGYYAITTDSNGNLYAAGLYTGSSGAEAWFVRQSLNGGADWATVDNVAMNGQPYALTTDAAGNVYVVGTGTVNSQGAWIVRKGTLGGVGIAWTNIDVVFGAAAYGVMAGPAGLFVGGSKWQTTGGGGWRWSVRRSIDGGANWTTVDTYSLSSQSSSAMGLGMDASRVYAVGRAGKSVKGKTISDWIVRWSTDGGSNWSTIDDFEYNGTWSIATAFATDTQGNHYVAGYGNTHWLVRKNLANTSSWSTVDNFSYTPAFYSEAFALLTEASGSVFAAGYGSVNSQNNNHWIVRKQ